MDKLFTSKDCHPFLWFSSSLSTSFIKSQLFKDLGRCKEFPIFRFHFPICCFGNSWHILATIHGGKEDARGPKFKWTISRSFFFFIFINSYARCPFSKCEMNYGIHKPNHSQHSPLAKRYIFTDPFISKTTNKICRLLNLTFVIDMYQVCITVQNASK